MADGESGREGDGPREIPAGASPSSPATYRSPIPQTAASRKSGLHSRRRNASKSVKWRAAVILECPCTTFWTLPHSCYKISLMPRPHAMEKSVESEEFKSKYTDNFDLVVSRATVPLIILFRYSLPLIKEKAYIAAVKGGDLMEEFKTAELKYKAHIKKSTIFELSYKPSNTRNEKGKKLMLIEINK